MHDACEVCVVVPVFCERQYILSLLESFARQEQVSKDQFEVLVVVNNPAEMEGGTFSAAQVLAENRFVLDMIRFINYESVDVEFLDHERDIVEAVKLSGLRVYGIDKSAPGRNLPPDQANVGGARNRGLAEAVYRFYYQKQQDGIVAHTDADAVVDDFYIHGLITAFNEQPDVVGFTGFCFDELQDVHQTELMDAFLLHLLELYYTDLFNILKSEKSTHALSDQLVNFMGSNMASRAFAAAEVNGVPYCAGLEDMYFGYRLAEKGNILASEYFKVTAAIRPSLRAKNSKGQGVGKHSNNGLEIHLKLKDPEQALTLRQILQTIQADLDQGKLTLPRLQEHLRIRMHPLLPDQTTCEFFRLLNTETNEPSVIKCLLSEHAQHILKEIEEAIDHRIGRIDAKAAYETIKMFFFLHPDMKRHYLEKKEYFQGRFQRFSQFLTQLLEYLYVNGLNRSIQWHQLQDIVTRKIMDAYGADALARVEMLKERFLFRRMVKILRSANNPKEAVDLIKSNFVGFQSFMTPAENSIAEFYLEACYLRESIFDKVFSYHN
jgi:hypothetical protein